MFLTVVGIIIQFVTIVIGKTFKTELVNTTGHN